MKRLRIGTRGSRLAQWQARHVGEALARRGIAGAIATIATSGDRLRGARLADFGGKGLFTKEIEEALRAAAIDVAVHSLKDVPTELPAGLELAAYLPRADARDALVTTPGRAAASLASLPAGARVGTSSLRRRAQLLALRPDLATVEVHGNVDTRLDKLARGDCEALLLAAAGLLRLGRSERIAEYLEIERMCPAAGQGILVLECRADDEETRRIVAALNDASSEAAATAERALLAALGAGCQTPIAAHARVDGEMIEMRAVLAEPDGRQLLRAAERGARDAARALGRQVAETLIRQGAREILARLERQTVPAPEAP